MSNLSNADAKTLNREAELIRRYKAGLQLSKLDRKEARRLVREQETAN